MKLTKERNIRANGTPNKTYNQGRAPLPHNGPINKERLKLKISKKKNPEKLFQTMTSQINRLKPILFKGTDADLYIRTKMNSTQF